MLALWCAGAAGLVWGQSRLPAETGNFLQVSNQTDGDRDIFQAIFFEVPDTMSGPINFAVYDPGVDDSQANADPDRGNTDDWEFRLVGGSGTLSGSTAQQSTFADIGEASVGVLLGTMAGVGSGPATVTGRAGTFASDINWVYFSTVYPNQGEHVGNKYYFKIVALMPNSGALNQDRNAFQVDVSLSDTGLPTSIATIRSFAYSWSMMYLDRPGTTWDLYPFIPEGGAGGITNTDLYNYDMDVSASNSGESIQYDSGSGWVGGSESAQAATGGRDTIAVTAGSNDFRTWQVRVIEGTSSGGGPVLNNTEIYALADNVTPLRIYAAPYTFGTADHVVATAADGQAKTNTTEALGGYERVSFQIVDAAGNAVPRSKPFTVSVSGAGRIRADSSGWTGTTTSRVVTASYGYAWVDVDATADGVVTISIADDTYNFPETVAHAGTTVTFVPALSPLIVMSSNVTLAKGTGPVLPSIRITAREANQLTVANDIRIKIPAGLNATFDNSVTIITRNTTGTGVVNTTLMAYEDGNKTAVLNVTTLFTNGSYVDISGLKLSTTNDVSSGSLSVDVDGSGGTASQYTDSSVIAVTDTYTWSGGTTNWATPGNWTPSGPPATNSKVVVSGGVANPTLDLSATNTTIGELIVETGKTLTLTGSNSLIVGNLTIKSGGSLVVSTSAGITVSGNFSNYGTFTASSGTLVMTGTGTINTGGASLNNLTIQSGTSTLGSATVLAGAFTVQAGAVLDASAANFALTVGANWVNNAGTSGFVARNGTVAISNTGIQTHTINGSTNFYNLSSTVAAAVPASITFDAAATIGIGGAISMTGNSTTNRLTLQSNHASNDWILNLTSGTGHTMNNLALFNTDLRGQAFNPVLGATVVGSGNDDAAGFNPPSVGVSAALYTWNGSASALWATAANWTPAYPGAGGPGAGDAVSIPDAGTTANDPVLAVNLTLDTLTLQANAVLDAAGFGISWITLSKDATSTLKLSGAQTLASFTNGTILSTSITEYTATAGGPFTIIDVDTGAGADYATLVLGGTVTQNAIGNINTGTLTISKTGGAANFQGDLTVTTAMTTTAAAYTLNLTGASNSIAGTTTLQNTAALTLGDNPADSTTFTGGLTVSGAGTKTLAGAIATTNTAMVLPAITLGGDTILSSGATGATITIASVNGSASNYNLDLRSRGSTTQVTGAVGLTNAVGTLTLHDNNALSTGLMRFDGAINAAILTVQAQGFNVQLSGGAAITGGTPTTFANTGILSLSGVGTYSFTAGVIATAPSSKTVAATVSAAGTGVINFGSTATTISATSILGGSSTGQITLAATSIAAGTTLSLGAGAASPVTTGAITGADATSNLTINVAQDPANPAVTIASMGTTIGTMTITQSSGVTISGALTATTLTITDTRAAQNINLNGDVTLTNLSVLAGTGAYNLRFSGTTNAVTAAVTFSNTGAVQFGNGGAGTTTLSGGATRSVGTITYAGAVRAAGTNSLTFTATGTATHSVTLGDANTGAIQCGALTIANGITFTVQNAAANQTFASIAGAGPGTSNFTSNSTSGAVAFNGVVNTNMGTLSLVKTGGTVTFDDAATLSLNILSIGAGAYGVVMNSNSVAVTTATTFANTGALTLGDDATDSQIYTGGLTATAPAGTRQIAGTITVSGAANMDLSGAAISVTADTVLAAGTGTITLPDLTLANNVTLNAGSGNATPLVFGGTVNGTAAGATSTVVINSTGAESFAGLWGTDISLNIQRSDAAFGFNQNATLTDLTVQTTAGAAVNFSQDLTVSGTRSFAIAGYNLSFTGTSVNFTGTGSTDFANTGTLQLGDDVGDTLTFTNGVSKISAVKTLAGTIATNNSPINLGTAGNIALAAATTLSSGSGQIDLYSISGPANVDLTINGSGAANLGTALQTFNLGSGNLVLSGKTAGAIVLDGATVSLNGITMPGTLQTFTLDMRGNTTTVTTTTNLNNMGNLTLGNANTDSTTFTGGLTKTTATSILQGIVAATNAAISLGAITLAENTTIDTNAAAPAAGLTLGAVTGATFNLTLETGAGIAADMNGTSVASVGTLTIQNMGGTASFSGSVGAVTLSVTGTVANVALSGGASITGGALTTFANTGTLFMTGGGTYTYTNGLTATAPSAKTLAATIATTDSAVNLTGNAITLSGNTAVSSGTATIQLANTTATPTDRSLALSGTGAATLALVNLGSAAGGVLNLSGRGVGGHVTVNGVLTAYSVTMPGASTGFNITLNGGGSSINQPVTFNNSGTLQLGDNAADTITFTNGIVATTQSTKTLWGTITATAGPVNFGTTASALGSNVSINAAGLGGAVSFAGLTGSNFDLAIAANAAQTVTFSGVVSGLGNSVAGAALSVTTGASVSFSNTLSTNEFIALTPPTTFNAAVTIGFAFAGTDAFGSNLTLNSATGYTYGTGNPVTVAGNLSLSGGGTMIIQTSQDDVNITGTVTGPAGGQNLTITTGTVLGQLGNISFGGTIGSALDVLVFEGNTVAFGAGVATLGNAGDDTGNNVTIRADSFTLATGTAVNLGTAGTFQIVPRGIGNTIEFGSTNTAIVTDVFIDADFASITAVSFLVGDAAHTGDIYWSGSGAALPYAVSLRNSGIGAINLASNYSATNQNLSMQSGSGNVNTTTGGAINLVAGSLNVTGSTLVIGVDTTVTANGGINLVAVEDDVPAATYTLTLNSSGTSVLGSTVGATRPLAGLVSNAGGTLSLGANISADLVTIDDPVTLSATVIIDDQTDNAAAYDVDFGAAATVNGGFALTLRGAGQKRFQAALGGTPLASLTQDNATGPVTFQQDVTTSGVISLLSDVTLDGLTLSSSGGTVTIGNGAGDDLSISSAIVNIQAANQILSIDAAISMANNLTLSAGNAAINVVQAVTPDSSASRTLTVNTSGVATMSAALGTVANPLAVLNSNAGGTIRFAGNIYADQISIFDNAELLANSIWDDLPNPAGGISVGGTTNGAFNLILAGPGTRSFTGTVGIGGGAGDSLTVSGAGTSTFQNTVTLARGMVQNAGASLVTFQQDVTLANSAAGTSSFAENVTLDGMTLNAEDAVTFGTAAGDALSLASGPVTLQGAGNYTINSTVSGAQDLILAGAGAKAFNAALATPASLTQNDGSGAATFYENVTVSGAIDMRANVTLDGLVITSSASTITFGNADTDIVTLATADVTITTAAANQAQTWNAQVRGGQNFTVESGTAASNFNAAIGSVTPIADFTISNTTGTVNFGDGTTDTINSTGALNWSAGIINLRGSSITTAGTQTYTATTRVVADLHANGSLDASAAPVFTAPNVYMDNQTGPGVVLTLSDGATVNGNLVLYRGTLNPAGQTISATGDIAMFGSGYIPNDPDRSSDPDGAGNMSGTNEFAYPAYTAAPPAYTPGGAGYTTASGAFTTAPNASVTGAGLNGGVVQAGSNFYTNGINLNGTANWQLRVQPTASVASLVTSLGFGTGAVGSRYSRMLNGQIDRVQVRDIGGAVNADCWLSAGEAVTETTALSCSNVAFSRPAIASARSVYDNLLEVRFNQALENTNDELMALVGAIVGNEIASDKFSTNAGALAFSNLYVWSDPVTGSAILPEVDGDNDGILDVNEKGTLVSVTGFGDIAANRPLYFQTGGATWNTDATGTSLGTANSTDRMAVHQTVVLNLALRKSRIYSANGKTTVANIGRDGAGTYVAGTDYDTTADGCRPVLIGVVTGKAPKTGTEYYNAHNLIHFRYSEPMDMSNAALSGADRVSGGLANAGNAALAGYPGPIRSSTTLGQINNVEAGSVTVAGLGLSWTGTYWSGARQYLAAGGHEENADKINLIYRTNAAGAENPLGAQAFTMFLAGYQIDSTSYWPGYLGNPAWTTATITDPGASALAVSQSYVATLVDGTGNPVEHTANSYAGKLGALAGVTATTNTAAALLAGMSPGWDTAPPLIPVAALPAHNIYTELDGATTKMKSFHFVTINDAPVVDNVDDNAGGSDGIRDSSWQFPSSAGELQQYTDELAAFSFESIPAPTVTTWNQSMNTAVTIGDLPVWNNPGALADLGAVSTVDDQYFRVDVDSSLATGNSWGSLTSMHVSYNASTGYVTDWAGNLMRSFTNKEAVERIPPNIELSLAAVAGRRVFVQFDEPVYHAGFTPIVASDFDICGPAGGPSLASPIDLTILETLTTGKGPGAIKVYITLPASFTITPDRLIELRLRTVNSTDVVDKGGNAMQTTNLYRFSNVGIGLANPVYAIDDIVNPDFGSGVEALKIFDGSGSLSGKGTVRMQVAKAAGLSLAYQNEALRLYHAADPAAGFMSSEGAYWSPIGIPGLIKSAVTNSKVVSGVQSATNPLLFDFTFPVEEYPKDTIVEFMMDMNGLPLAWTPNVDDPRQLRAWGFSVGGIREQRAGVTILNNVINPDAGDKAILQYQVSEPGFVNIIVYTIDGNVVRALQRGRQAKGEYLLPWDGKNNNGQTVARGLYLIRAVGPGFDEYRKVLVVR